MGTFETSLWAGAYTLVAPDTVPPAHDGMPMPQERDLADGLARARPDAFPACGTFSGRELRNIYIIHQWEWYYCSQISA